MCACMPCCKPKIKTKPSSTLTPANSVSTLVAVRAVVRPREEQKSHRHTDTGLNIYATLTEAPRI